MISKEQQYETNNSINGKWTSKSANKEYNLLITDGESSLEISEEGKIILKDVFSGSCAWFGQNLIFTDQMKYRIRFANKEKMIFGESKTGMEGNTIWEFEFARV
ncbi:MAG: hypothetical protein ACO1G9_09800 [Bacteroidota bacterium]